MTGRASGRRGARYFRDYEIRLYALSMRTGVDFELRSLLRDELRTLCQYIERFNDMTEDEKDGLREWMAHGKSVNSNPFYIYGDNGRLMDFINASRLDEDMLEEHELSAHDDIQGGGDPWPHNPDPPF